MTLETQLRALAEATSAEQQPVTADEAIAHAVDRDLRDDPPAGRRWMLVAATIVLVAAGLVVLLALDGAPEDPVPGATIPEPAPATTVPAPAPTVAPATTVTGEATPTSAAATTVPLDAPTESLVNEPTLEYRDGVEWWTATALPEGWRYGYATDDGQVQTIRLLGEEGSTIDIGFDRSAVAGGGVDGVAVELGGEIWELQDDGGVGVLGRVVDGRLLTVTGPVDAARSVAAVVERVSESELVRPPFRADADPGPVVLTLSADAVGRDEPFELRAHTDGLFTTVGGEIERVSPEDPLAFGDPVYELTGDAEVHPVVLAGVALDTVEQIRFGLHDGGTVGVATTGSDRFGESFYAVVIEVPAVVLEQYERGELARLTRWTLTHVDGEQRVYDEPGAANCVDCEPLASVPAPASAGSPLVFEPTNVFGDDSWLVPSDLPEGFEYGYASLTTFDGAAVHEVVYHRDDGMRGDSVAVETHLPTEGPATTVPDEPADAEQVEVGGDTWSWQPFDDTGERGMLTRVVDGRPVRVTGERGVAVAAAAALEVVPESQLPRPPFRDDPSTSPVVATLSGAEAPSGVQTEMRLATDGVWVSFDSARPIRLVPTGRVDFFGGFAAPSPEPGAGADVFVISGMTTPDVATLEFEQLDGTVVTVVPEDASGHYGVGFFLVAIEIPAGGSDTYASIVPSVIARDADGNVVAAISEPF